MLFAGATLATTACGPKPAPDPKPGLNASQGDIAAWLNRQGEAELAKKRYNDASAKFREAVARSPEPAYFYNLCRSLTAEAKLHEAMTACNAVLSSTPTDDLRQKAEDQKQRIRADASNQGIDLDKQVERAPPNLPYGAPPARRRVV